MKKLLSIFSLVLVLFIFFPTDATYANFGNGASTETNDLPFVGNHEALVLDHNQGQYFFDPTKNSLTTDGDFTIEAWIKLNQFYAGGSWLVTKDDGVSNRQFGLAAADIQKLALQVRGVGNINSNNASLSTNTWTYVAVVWHSASQNADFYINGVLDSIIHSSATIPSSGNAGELQVGKRQDGNTGTMDGKISDVRIWNIARTASQIAANYNQTLIGNEPGLVAYYPRWTSDLNVPLLKQTSPPWQSLEYDTAHVWSPLAQTINDWGCALTSAAMVFKFHGINKLPDGTTLDPGTLNTWLKNEPDGYIGTGWVNWIALSRLSRLATSINSITAFDGLEYTRVASTDASIASSPSAKLTDDITHNLPDILEEPGHFIVAKGINGSTFAINDPYFDRQTLNDSYGNTFINAGTYTPSHTDLSYILLIVNQNVNLNFQNSNNQVVGNQFIQQPLLNDTNGNPAGSPLKFLYLPKPNNGDYIATLSAGQNQTYQFGVYLYDKDGNVQISTYSGVLGPNSKDTFTISFNKDNTSSTSKPTTTFQNVIDDINILYSLKQVTKKDRKNDLINLMQKADKIFKSKPFKPKELKQKFDDFELDLKNEKGKTISQLAYDILFADIEALRKLTLP